MIMRLKKQINQIHYKDFEHWFNKPTVTRDNQGNLYTDKIFDYIQNYLR